MAQNFTLPITFEFRPRRWRWQRSSYKIAGRASSFEPPAKYPVIIPPRPAPLGSADLDDEILVVLTSKLKTAPWTTGVDDVLFRAFPDHLASCLHTVAQLEREGLQIPESLSEMFVCFNREDGIERVSDPWQMRDEFMHLPQNNDALLRFLNRWGNWDYGALAVHSYTFSLAEFTKATRRLPFRLSYLATEKATQARHACPARSVAVR